MGPLSVHTAERKERILKNENFCAKPVQSRRISSVHAEVRQQDVFQVVDLVRLQSVQRCVQAHEEVLVETVQRLLCALLDKRGEEDSLVYDIT